MKGEPPMINILKPEFLKWNGHNSKEHFDLKNDPNSWEGGAETYFNVHENMLLSMCAYSLVKKDYTIDTEGVRILSQEQKLVETVPFDEDDLSEQHEIEIDWVITQPDGHVSIEIDGVKVEIVWEDGLIKDLEGNEARLLKTQQGHYKIEEILSPQEEETLVEIKRLARLRDMSKGDIRTMLNNKIMELAR
jgi:hypothetical protein